MFVAAGLAVAATFLVTYTVGTEVGNRELRFVATSWGTDRDDFGDLLQFSPIAYGVPTVTAGVLMAASAVLAFRQPVARLGSLVGAGMLVGLAWLSINTIQETVERLEALQAPVRLEVTRGDGVTLLVVAAGVGMVAALLHQELPWQRRPGVAADGVVIHQLEGDGDDTDTPPYGFPVVVEPKSD